MTDKIAPDKISGLSSTLLIPLWAKAVEYERPDALLKDAEAVRMVELIDYDFSSFGSAKLSQIGCCGRSLIIDNEVRRFIGRYPDGVVVQLGAGLDARFERLGRPPITAWYDLDLPEVMTIRQLLLPESGNRYLTGSMFDRDWVDVVSMHNKPVLLILEGVLMYFEEAEIKRLFAMVRRHFTRVGILFDSVPPLALGHAKHHDALRNMERTQRPEFVWALKNPSEMENWQPGLKVTAQFHLSDLCRKRYPWWARLAYKIRWVRRMFDQMIYYAEIDNNQNG